jgi:hypothetical protein
MLLSPIYKSSVSQASKNLSYVLHRVWVIRKRVSYLSNFCTSPFIVGVPFSGEGAAVCRQQLTAAEWGEMKAQ